jgi:hypothetical protein
MPIHDWTRVDAGIFHDFHLSWIAEIKRTLNQGLLPPDYYALAEQITGNMAPDVLTLCRPVSRSLQTEQTQIKGGIAVAIAPPKTRFHGRLQTDPYARKARTVVVRHRSGHQIIAMIEIVSPGNKGSQTDLAAFVQKADHAVRAGIHLMIVDLFPPNPRAPEGIHKAIWSDECEKDFALPADKPLSCASYVGYPCLEVFLEPVAVGDKLPKMPVFLTPETYIPLPLEKTYLSAWEAVPAVWQETLTASSPRANGHNKSRRRRV